MRGSRTRNVLFLILGIILASGGACFGAPTAAELEAQLKREENRLSELQGQVTMHRKKLSEAKVKEKSVLSKLQEYNEKVALAGQRINVMQVKQKRVELRISELTREIVYTK